MQVKLKLPEGAIPSVIEGEIGGHKMAFLLDELEEEDISAITAMFSQALRTAWMKACRARSAPSFTGRATSPQPMPQPMSPPMPKSWPAGQEVGRALRTPLVAGLDTTASIVCGGGSDWAPRPPPIPT